MMSLKNKLHWGALAAEFAVVVLGILGALWVDEWRDARQDAALEQVYLARLEEDLTASLDRLEPVIGRDKRVRDQIRAAMALLDGPNTPAARDSLGRLWGDRRFWNVASLKLETVESLLEPGYLTGLRTQLEDTLAAVRAAQKE